MRTRILLAVITLPVLAVCLAGIAWWFNQSYQHSTSDRTLWRTQFIDLHGVVQKIPQPKQRPLIINFWATWCGPCREEMPVLSALARTWQGKVDVVGVAVDNAAAVQQFLATAAVTYPILLGQADVIDVMKSEGNTVGGLPFTVVYAADGHQMMAKAGEVQKNVLEKLLYNVVNAQ